MGWVRTSGVGVGVDWVGCFDDDDDDDGDDGFT